MRRKVKSGLKKVLLIYGGMLTILVITCITVYIMYNNKIKESAKQSLLATEKITQLVPNNDILEQVSSQISKTINEITEENKIIDNQIIENQEAEINVEPQEIEQEEIETVVEPEPVKELEFAYPVAGEILKGFSMQNLVFSETLQEWIVHKGIDIKAPRTTVVQASEEGTVKSIKNDPRYGLTVIVEHRDGYKTIYSNLLTTEFVTEGEEIIKGQSIGTVGNSAAFEIADEPHLHFEMLKDEENIDPTLYLK